MNNTKFTTKLANLLSNYKCGHPDVFNKIIENIGVQISEDGDFSLDTNEYIKIINLLVNKYTSLTPQQMKAVIAFKKYFIDVLIQITVAEITELHSDSDVLREEHFIMVTDAIYSANNKISTAENSKAYNEQTKLQQFGQIYNSIQDSIVKLRSLLIKYINEITNLNKSKNVYKHAIQLFKLPSTTAKIIRCKHGLELYEKAVELCELLRIKIKSNPDRTVDEYKIFLIENLTSENCKALRNYDWDYQDGFWKKWENKISEFEHNELNEILECYDFDNITD